MNKATKMIDVDKIFLAKSNEGAVYVLNALKICLYWKTINEYIMDIYEDHFDITLYEGNMFGSIMAFNRRCKDLYEICQANGQLFTSFSNQEESSMDKDQQQINRIYLEYSKLLSSISQVRHKCLDIKDHKWTGDQIIYSQKKNSTYKNILSMQKNKTWKRMHEDVE